MSQHGLVEHDGQWFLLMELLEGVELMPFLRGETPVPRLTASGVLASTDERARALFLHLTGADDDELEACFSRHDAYGLKAPRHSSLKQ